MTTQSALQQLSHSPIHALMEEAAMQGGQLLIRSNLEFSILLKYTSKSSWESQGFEPATFRLLDNPVFWGRL